jgi:hypothetical protein
MRDIKYFFLNKINQTIQRGKQISRGGEGVNYRKYYFSKSRGAPWYTVDPPLGKIRDLSYVPLKISMVGCGRSWVRNPDEDFYE